MLKTLTIENVAIIDKIEIDFTDGFNCLTGETGAGKSILIDSIGAVLGSKTSRDLIRTGEKKATVSALFCDVDPAIYALAEEMGIDLNVGDDILIFRAMYLDGKNVCRINDEVVTVSMLKKFCEGLVNIHGQSDSDSLMRDENHLKFLDDFCGDNEERSIFTQTYLLAKKKQAELEKLVDNRREQLKRADLLSFQADEIEKAKITVGEKAQLQQMRLRASNSVKLQQSLQAAISALDDIDDENGAVTRLFDSASSLEKAGEIMADAKPLAQRLGECAYNVSDLSSEIKELLMSIDNEMNLDEIEQRLDVINTLSRKYGEGQSDSDEENILCYYDCIKKELDDNFLADEKIGKLNEEFKALKEKSKALAEHLSETRHKYGEILSKKIESELDDLCMSGTKFVCKIDRKKICPDGIDDVKFYISTNKGEQEKPLSKTASGGELSRIMLAIKNVLNSTDTATLKREKRSSGTPVIEENSENLTAESTCTVETPQREKRSSGTLVFDEIDRGVSGRAADAIGMKMYELSRKNQCLIITHLPSVVSYCDSQFLIKKVLNDERTTTTVTRLDREGQIREIARLIGGDENDEVNRRAGEHLLVQAQKRKDEEEKK